MAKKSIPSLLGGGGKGSTLLGDAKKPKADPLAELRSQNDNTRARLAASGIKDPTKESKPSALERIMGPLDALGAGTRSLVYNAVSDKDVNPLAEMGKALKGEKRIEGADILDELGVDNKWGKMFGGMVVDVLVDPITYVTLGFGSAAKSSGKAALEAVAKYGDDAVRVGEFLGKNADDAARIIQIAKDSGLIDDAGKFAAEGLNALGKEGSQALMTNLYKEFGTGGVKFAGIPLGGEDAASRFGYKAKELARMVPGSRWAEQTFGIGSLPGEAVDLMREGNEGVNVLVKALRSQVGRSLKVNEAVSERFAKELMGAIPDEASRVWASVAIGRQFGDDAALLADKVDAVRAAMGNADELGTAMDDLVTFRSGLLGRARDNIETTLRTTAGLSDEQVEQALKGIDLYDARLQDLYKAQKERGLLSMGVFGDDATGYLPGVAAPEKASGAADDVMKQLGVDVDALRPQTKQPKSGFLSSLTPDDVKRKQFLTPEDRLLGRARGGEAVDSIATELDLARLGLTAQKNQGRRIVLDDFQKELAQALGNEEFASRVTKSVERFFTDDESTKGFLRIFDKVNNLWKRQATVMRFPAFQSRNGISNKLLMFQDGALSVAGEAKSLGVIEKMMQAKAGTLSEEAANLLADELDDMVRHGVLTSFEEISEQVGKGGGNRLTRFLGDLNSVIENQSRISSYFTYLNKGMSKTAAGEMVNKALFDYSDEALSVFERNVMKRIVPFYKWTKANLSKQTRVLFESPGRTAWLGHLKESGEAVSDYDKSVEPSWLRDLYPIPLPISDGGDPVMLSTAGLFPQGDLELLSGVLTGKFDPKDAFGSLSPILRTPLELLFNKDLWYDTDIASYEGQKKRAPQYIEVFGDLATRVPGIGDVWRFIADKFGIDERTDDTGESYYWMNAKAVKAMRDMVPWMNNVSKVLDQSQRKSKYDNIMFGTGVKPILFDTQRFAVNQAYDDRDALNDALTRGRDEGLVKDKPKTVGLDELFGGR